MSSRDENACKAVINVFWSAVLAMALFATVRTGVWQRKGLLPLLALLAYVFTLHLFYEALSRHHIPVLAALILVAAAGAARVARPNYGSSGTRS